MWIKVLILYSDVLFICLHQSVAVFTPLIVILVFAFLKKSERGDLKEATLGKKAEHRYLFFLLSQPVFLAHLSVVVFFCHPAVTLTLVLNGVFTNVIKLVVGR